MEFYNLRGKKEGERAIVSIPNGMEFYAAAVTTARDGARVSIPNGMEFYIIQSSI